MSKDNEFFSPRIRRRTFHISRNNRFNGTKNSVINNINENINSQDISSPNHLIKLKTNSNLISPYSNNINKFKTTKKIERINNNSRMFKNLTINIKNNKEEILSKNSEFRQNKKINLNKFLTERNINVDAIKNRKLSFTRQNTISSKLNHINLNLNNLVKASREIKRTNTIKYPNKNLYIPKRISINPVNLNPLLIPEEDKIFDEMKKYICYKIEKKENILNKFNLSANNYNENNIYNHSPETHIMKLKLHKEENKKKMSFDQIKLKYLYISNDEINQKLKYIKKRKDSHTLKGYQDNLLETVKLTLPHSRYIKLKDKLCNIRNKSEQINLSIAKNIKEIEVEEEDIINDINNLYKQCLKTFSFIRENKEMIHSSQMKIKLPLLNFKSCFKTNKEKYKNQIEF